MAVNHLQKRESGGFCCNSIADQSHRVGNAAADRPKHPGARPDHAFQHFTAAQSLSTILRALVSHVTSPCGPNGSLWRRYTGDSAVSGFIPKKYTQELSVS